MNVQLLGVMISDVIDDFSRPASAWQLATLIACLVIAWGLSKFFIHRLSQRQDDSSLASRYARTSLRRAFFPLLGWLLVLFAKWVLTGYQSTKVLQLALVPLFGLTVLYVTFFMARRVLGVGSKAVSAVKFVEKILATLVWVGMLLYVLGMFEDFVTWLDSNILFTINKKNKVSLLMIVSAAAWIVCTMVVALFLSSVLNDRLERTQLEPNLREVISRVIRVLFLVVALLLSLNLVGIDITVLSVFGGAFVVALGFGLQKIASNYVAGFTVLLDRSIKLGDLIAVDKHYGVVTQIRPRYTVLHAPDDTEVLVPNEAMVASVVKNFSYSQKMLRLAVQVQASYKSDPHTVLKVLANVADGIPRILKDPEPSAYLVSFGDSGVLYEFGFWIEDAEQGRLNVQSQVNLAIWDAFQQHGLEIPYPQRELRVIQQSPNIPA